MVMANPPDTMVVDKETKKNAAVRDVARATWGRRKTKASKPPGVERVGRGGGGWGVETHRGGGRAAPAGARQVLGSVGRVAQHPGQLQARPVGVY